MPTTFLQHKYIILFTVQENYDQAPGKQGESERAIVNPEKHPSDDILNLASSSGSTSPRISALKMSCALVGCLSAIWRDLKGQTEKVPRFGSCAVPSVRLSRLGVTTGLGG